MHNKIRVGILFGGRSAEHSISLLSARSVLEGLDREKYDVVLIGLDKKNQWYLQDPLPLSPTLYPETLAVVPHLNERVTVIPGQTHGLLTHLMDKESITAVDVIFPVLHGPYGEDGTIQSVLKLANIPFVGSDVLSSAICMDKDITKRLLRDAKLPVAKFITLYEANPNAHSDDEIIAELGLPCFVKPANLGSSIGMSKVKTKKELREAINQAFAYDTKVLVEEFIQGREIECAVLGNADPKASIPGEIVPHDEYYTYKAKYLDPHGADVIPKADLPKATIAKIQDLAIKAFQTLQCQGMARVDFFLKDDKEIYINELNTIPGFTAISQYPKMWEASGVSFPALIDKLIELALERYDKQQTLKIEV